MTTNMAAFCGINTLLKKKKWVMGGGEGVPNLLPVLLQKLYQMVLDSILGLFDSNHIFWKHKGHLL